MVFREEVVDEGELDLVPREDLRRIVRSLRENPERGKPLSGTLVGCRSLHVGSDNRLVYRLVGEMVEIIAIGRRRAEEVYEAAARRA